METAGGHALHGVERTLRGETSQHIETELDPENPEAETFQTATEENIAKGQPGSRGQRDVVEETERIARLTAKGSVDTHDLANLYPELTEDGDEIDPALYDEDALEETDPALYEERLNSTGHSPE